MNRTQTFIVYGEPVGKGRPRFTTYGGNVRAVTPAKTRSYEEYVKMAFLQEHRKVFDDEPLQVNISCFFGIPNSWSKKKKQKAANGEIFPTKKPDTDNIIKIILDSLNGIAYADDKNVIGVTITKGYSLTPRVEVSISEVVTDG